MCGVLSQASRLMYTCVHTSRRRCQPTLISLLRCINTTVVRGKNHDNSSWERYKLSSLWYSAGDVTYSPFIHVHPYAMLYHRAYRSIDAISTLRYIYFYHFPHYSKKIYPKLLLRYPQFERHVIGFSLSSVVVG